jgi:hypothetical protein
MIVEHLKDSGRPFGALALAVQIPALLLEAGVQSSRQVYHPFPFHWQSILSGICICAILVAIVLGFIGIKKDELKGLAIFAAIFPFIAFLIYGIGV